MTKPQKNEKGRWEECTDLYFRASRDTYILPVNLNQLLMGIEIAAFFCALQDKGKG